MSLYPASIIDQDSVAQGQSIFYPGLGTVKVLLGTARITSTTATSWPVYVRGNKLGEQDVPLVIPAAAATTPGGRVTIISAGFHYPSRITLPTQTVATNGNELTCVSGELLALTSANVLTGSAATASLTTSTIAFSGTNTVTAADVGLLKFAMQNPFGNEEVVNPNLVTSVHSGAVSIRNLTAAGNLQTLGTGVSLNTSTIPTGFGRDNAFISIPVFVNILVAPQAIEVTDVADFSVSGFPY